MSKELRLPLKKKWFYMTGPNGKPEDYRDINEYWVKRLGRIKEYHTDYDLQTFILELKNGNIAHDFFEFNKFDTNVMTLGYPKKDDKERIKKYEHKGIKIDYGNPDWGAEPGKLYFVIMHGKRID